MRALIWKFKYTRHMQRRANCSFGFAWANADAWVEAFGMDDTPSNAAEEEMSNWDGEGL
jgi:hypothetical protein